MFNSKTRWWLLPAALLLAAPAQAVETIDDLGVESGLQLVEKDSRGAIYAQPDADWSTYDAILLEEASVAFRKNWQRDQNRDRRALSERVSTSDMERIKRDLAQLFDEVFSDSLAENDAWALADAAGPNVLRVRPRIVDLDVYAPDVRSSTQTRSFTDSSGRMTLILELYDSETGDLLAAASDRREAPHRGYLQWTTSVSNKGDARRMMQQWATALNERLAAATERTATD